MFGLVVRLYSIPNLSVQESKTLEIVSGIPVAKLKANDPEVTSLDLKGSGCGPAEAFILGAILKVITKPLIRRVYLYTNIASQRHTHAYTLHEGARVGLNLRAIVSVSVFFLSLLPGR